MFSICPSIYRGFVISPLKYKAQALNKSKSQKILQMKNDGFGTVYSKMLTESFISTTKIRNYRRCYGEIDIPKTI